MNIRTTLTAVATGAAIATLTVTNLSCGRPLTPAEATALHAGTAAAEAAACAGLKAEEKNLSGLPLDIEAIVCAIAGDPVATAANEASVRASLAALPVLPAQEAPFLVTRDGRPAGRIRDKRAREKIAFPLPQGDAGAPRAVDAGRGANDGGR